MRQAAESSSNEGLTLVQKNMVAAIDIPTFIQSLHVAASSFGKEPLLALPSGRSIDLASGYIPLLVNFTYEDKAAKGLRKRQHRSEPEPPIYVSALELVRDHQCLALSGPSGSGKSTFAKWLCWRLATTGLGQASPVVRNENGDVREESWDTEGVVPWYFPIGTAESLRDLVESTVTKLIEFLSVEVEGQAVTVLIVLDRVNRLGDGADKLLLKLIDRVRDFNKVKLLILSEAIGYAQGMLPSDVPQYDLLPLLKSQRQQSVGILTSIEPMRVQTGMGAASDSPALFALALRAENPGDIAEVLLDTWVSLITANQEVIINDLANLAYDQIKQESSLVKATAFHANIDDSIDSSMLRLLAVKELLAARHLARMPPEVAYTLFQHDPWTWASTIRSLLKRLVHTSESRSLIDGLIRGSGPQAQRGALLVSDATVILPPDVEDYIGDLIIQIIEEGTLLATEREKAGRVLSRLGDSRDLQALAAIPSGTFTMGSYSYMTSQPPHMVFVDNFRIGVFPVVNQNYGKFAQETNRQWHSPDSEVFELRNAPATDVTWHDANAYCSWLTLRWHAEGRIPLDEQVRLPTEPEWERAARGDLKETEHNDVIYPWGTQWLDGANCEELPFNRTCAVGLFPRGRSQYGCQDMVGHVWEWCTTLWGEDMATPSFKYPWSANDGREDAKAPEAIRRVLRGGCFSSGRLKVSCSYRGSLEPAGFWRGNGFRIVVAKV
jgi:iron(II)-dependent oxidoreductase